MFQHIWFIWSILVFIPTGIIATICYFVIFNVYSGEKALKHTFTVTNIWAKVLLTLILSRTKVDGAEQLDPNEKYILISNHLSAMDIPFCMYCSPVPFSFLAKIEVDKIPIIGYLARNMHVYVDRKSNKSRVESFERMQNHLNTRGSIHIFVEGTRNKSDQPLGRFYDGAFRLAIETQRPIAVLTINGSKQVLDSKQPFKSSPSNIHCIWSTPISTKGMTMKDLPRLKEQAREMMLANLHPVPVNEIVM